MYIHYPYSAIILHVLSSVIFFMVNPNKIFSYHKKFRMNVFKDQLDRLFKGRPKISFKLYHKTKIQNSTENDVESEDEDLKRAIELSQKAISDGLEDQKESDFEMALRLSQGTWVTVNYSL